MRSLRLHEAFRSNAALRNHRFGTEPLATGRWRSSVFSVKNFYRLAGLVILCAVAFVTVGTLLPPGNPIGDAADRFLDALSISWIIPAGLTGT